MNNLNMTIRLMDGPALSGLIEMLSELEIAVLKGPEVGLIMVSATDPFSTDFHLGEALVTQAIVEYRGEKGFGMLLGDQPERAIALASVDALDRAGAPELEKIGEALEPEHVKVMEALKREEAIVESTRVKFESMVIG